MLLLSIVTGKFLEEREGLDEQSRQNGLGSSPRHQPTVKGGINVVCYAPVVATFEIKRLTVVENEQADRVHFIELHVLSFVPPRCSLWQLEVRGIWHLLLWHIMKCNNTCAILLSDSQNRK